MTLNTILEVTMEIKLYFLDKLYPEAKFGDFTVAD